MPLLRHMAYAWFMPDFSWNRPEAKVLRTAESLRLVTGHMQMAGNNEQVMTKVGKDPGVPN